MTKNHEVAEAAAAVPSFYRDAALIQTLMIVTQNEEGLRRTAVRALDAMRVAGEALDAEQDACEAEEERKENEEVFRDRLYSLGEAAQETVLGVIELARQSVPEASGLTAQMARLVRPLARELGDGELVHRLNVVVPGGNGHTSAGTVPRFARDLLEEQIRRGEARVSWDERGKSRGRRVETARLILDVAARGGSEADLAEALTGHVARPDAVAAAASAVLGRDALA